MAQDTIHDQEEYCTPDGDEEAVQIEAGHGSESQERAEIAADKRAGDTKTDRDNKTPGSLPGVMIFARTPTTRPMRIQDSTPMATSLFHAAQSSMPYLN